MVEEVSEARIWAGFHYRFSTRVGQLRANAQQPRERQAKG
jgi:hypothetical protein